MAEGRQGRHSVVPGFRARTFFRGILPLGETLHGWSNLMEQSRTSANSFGSKPHARSEDCPPRWRGRSLRREQLLQRLRQLRFERINRRYARHLKILGERPGGALRNDAAAKALLRWAAAEREAWLDAVTNDPLLPGRILPADYLGQQARWPPAKAGGGWKCSGTPAGNCARSNPNSPVQTFVAYATKVRHAAYGVLWFTMNNAAS